MPTKNERNTENIVREQLRELGYFDAISGEIVEEQKSNVEHVSRLLRIASKSGGGGVGSPEFIISSPATPDFIVIIECKADRRDHISQNCAAMLAGDKIQESESDFTRRIQRFAADGALHYARYLAREFNVVAVAVSGENKSSVAITTYLHPKIGPIAPIYYSQRQQPGVPTGPKQLQTRDGAAINKLIPWADFIEHGTFDPAVQKIRFEDLMEFATVLHDFMRDHAKLTESEKPLIVSGTLIALLNKPFSISFGAYTPEALQEQWFKVIHDEIQKADIPKAKKDNMSQPYSSIAVHPELGKATKTYPQGVLYELISLLNSKVWPFLSVYHDFDVVGQFYGEFLKYTGGDKKALGIVLTPRHVTELFALLANVNKDSIALDICAGTGGFLISAMHQMMRSAQTAAEGERIRKQGLVGVEQQPNMFALAASNMILRGDGKANLYQGSCFDPAIVEAVKLHKCNVGLLNPPFSQADAELGELFFIKQLLDCLEVGGTGIVIVPMSCAISPHPARAEILERHTLEAVMSMPDELFYPVGTVTCIMVFTAHIPHATSDKKTWFGYWKNDGFVKTKHRGRVNLNNAWAEICPRWVEMYRNREVHAGESVMQKVTHRDEWCAEAYIQTDYTKISKADFEAVVKNYAMFKLLGASIGVPHDAEAE